MSYVTVTWSVVAARRPVLAIARRATAHH